MSLFSRKKGIKAPLKPNRSERIMAKALRWLFPLWLALPALTGCGDDVQDTYARTPAFLRFTPVSAVAPLYNALRSPGVFCQITYDQSQYHFKGNSGITASYPRTALDAYGQPECVAGFLIGTPSVPDMNMQTSPTAYDLVCPYCYGTDVIQRSLAFSSGEQVACSRCGRTYDLAQNGIETSGKGGASLYRYHLTYSEANDLLLVQN